MRKNTIRLHEPDLIHYDKAYVKGKFLYRGTDKLYIKGVTYGTFAPQQNGVQYPSREVVQKDFNLMAQHGLNCVRTYTVPPKYLLDLALEHDLHVMVGLPWEQHITFLDEPKRSNDIVKRVQEGVAACNQHPAILCYAVGNEIPATIVRWYGKKKIEGFIRKLYHAVKEVDAHTLVTYVNYPTTEYLDLSFLDFDCFNVYLETPEKLRAYIARLHNLAGNRPLLLAEIGLDSMRNGLSVQAETLRWQIQTIFGQGCAGMFVFAWTDEWWRGGFDIEDWDFGLVDRQRNAKPALHAVSETMEKVPFATDKELPFISVVVCTYNGSATIKDTLEGLLNLDYPLFEVIVVNDGSKDCLQQIVEQYPVRLINTANMGLSSARNTGMYHARGEIVAYIDDDAYPDPHWLRYLAAGFINSTHAGIGGPNISPAEDGMIARCVANAPGGPVHVLLSDEIAEHIPGCNMAFRKDVLLDVGGCDPVYRAAGDDVDLCWRIQQSGRTIGFHPAAVVWHHRRNSIKAYWRQQTGYGKAEALLEAKWPEKYNGFGHLAWSGRIYGNGFTVPINFKKGKVFHGTWGSALFQSVYQPAGNFLNCLPLMPEWYLFITLLGSLSLLGLLWQPLFWAFPVMIGALLIVLTQATISAFQTSSLSAHERNWQHFVLIIVLHVLQPLARLCGRLRHGLTPWRKKGNLPIRAFFFVLRPKEFTYWSETWRSMDDWLLAIEAHLLASKIRVKRGGDYDRWDFQLRNGVISINKTLLTIEEHGANKQYIRLKTWTIPSRTNIYISTSLLGLSIISAVNHAWVVSGILLLFCLILVVEYFADSAVLLSKVNTAFGHVTSVQSSSLSILKEKEHVLAVVQHLEIKQKAISSQKSAQPITLREMWFQADSSVIPFNKHNQHIPPV